MGGALLPAGTAASHASSPKTWVAIVDVVAGALLRSAISAFA